MGKKKNKETQEEIKEEEKVEETNTEENKEVEEKEEEKKELTCEEKILVLNDKYLRLQADVQNIKRHNAQQVLEAKERGKVEFFESMLETFDNFDSAFKMNLETPEAKDSFIKGMEMIQMRLHQNIQDHKIEEIKCEGQFDPLLHEPTMTETVKGKKEDEIISVIQKGYVLNGKVIRHAKVKVNKKGN